MCTNRSHADDALDLAAEPLAQQYGVASCSHELVAPHCYVDIVQKHCLRTCNICMPPSSPGRVKRNSAAKELKLLSSLQAAFA